MHIIIILLYNIISNYGFSVMYHGRDDISMQFANYVMIQSNFEEKQKFEYQLKGTLPIHIFYGGQKKYRVSVKQLY